MTTTFDQILSLAEQLSPSERDTLVDTLQAARADEHRREWCDLCDQMAGSMADDPM